MQNNAYPFFYADKTQTSLHLYIWHPRNSFEEKNVSIQNIEFLISAWEYVDIMEIIFF